MLICYVLLDNLPPSTVTPLSRRAKCTCISQLAWSTNSCTDRVYLLSVCWNDREKNKKIESTFAYVRARETRLCMYMSLSSSLSLLSSFQNKTCPPIITIQKQLSPPKKLRSIWLFRKNSYSRKCTFQKVARRLLNIDCTAELVQSHC